MRSRAYRPYDLGVWLDWVDVNVLSDADADKIAHVDVENDDVLAWLVAHWIRPHFLVWNVNSQSVMIEVLRISDAWTEKQLRPVFDAIAIPSQQRIIDIERFLGALRKEFLSEE